MNKHVSRILIVVLAIALAAGTLYVALTSNQTDYTTKLQALLDTEWREYSANRSGFSGGLAMQILSPKGNFFVSTGMGDQVTQNTHFRVASTTKTFTSAAIMMLHQEGQLRIDDYITANIPGTDTPYVPDSPAYDIPFKAQITIRQLLEHRAGVFDVSNNPIPDNASALYAGKNYLSYVKEDLAQPEHTFSFDELVGVVAANQLSHAPPDTVFHYSNTGYSLLGKIIERVSGMSYASFVEQRLLQPNGLSDTSFPATGNEQQIPSPYVDGYVWFNGALYQATLDNMSPHVAEGNAISTPENLSRWAKLLYSAQAGITREYVNMMTDVKPTGEEHGHYGLGTTYTNGLGYGHNGAHVGYMTLVRYDPETDTTMMIVASVLNAEDLYSQINCMYDIGRSAKQVLGLSS